jgi:hypothetical protein
MPRVTKAGTPSGKDKLAALFLTEVVEGGPSRPLTAPNTVRPKEARKPSNGGRYCCRDMDGFMRYARQTRSLQSQRWDL